MCSLQASALFFPLTLLLAGCSGLANQPPSDPSLNLAPGARMPAWSLFGTDVIGLPNGLSLTPDAVPGARLATLNPHLANAPEFLAGGAAVTAVSPDGRTLLLLTSGYNRLYDTDGRRAYPGQSEYVFVYDISTGEPRETQVVEVPNTFFGIAFDPRGGRFHVSGGADDVLRSYALDSAGKYREEGAAVALGHRNAQGLGGLGVSESPYAAGVAVTSSGALVVVANHENDSLSLVDPTARQLVGEVPLRPGGGVAGGEYPLAVLTLGESRAYVTCQRDREVVVVDLAKRSVVQRIRVGGQPTRLIANRAGTRLYVANANSDTVSVINVARGVVIGSIPTAAPPSHDARDGVSNPLLTLRGSNPNALALSPDEQTLYVTNGGNNTLAVIALDERRPTLGAVVGLVPTGFYPDAVSLSPDGRRVFVAHGKSPTGPNIFGPWSPIERVKVLYTTPRAGNQLALQLSHGGLLSFPLPAAETLARLTTQALANNRAAEPVVPAVFAALRGKVQHIIYVIAENRSYDQILGDIPGADGDRALVHWGDTITPNQHAIARGFVTFDRFFDSGGVSGDGWQWSVSGRTTDVAEKAIPVEYADRGDHSYDWEGMNRNVNVGLPTLAERLAFDPNTPNSPDLLPGTADVGAVDGPAEGGRGFLWDAVLGAGLTFRNYGCFLDNTRYGLPLSDPARVLRPRMPAATKTRVAFPTRVALQTTTDPYYRAFDMSFADFWRVEEWGRELDEYVAHDNLPALEMVRLPHDHLGGFEAAEDGLGTPDTQMADHDYALGRLIEKLSHTKYWESTVVIALEDDAQNGSDHVDAHRSLLFMAGGHVVRGRKVSVPYTTVSVLRTIELLLGIPALGQQDGVASPIDGAFSVDADLTPYAAKVPAVLRSSSLPLPPAAPGERASAPRGDRASWAAASLGLDFSREDNVPTATWNRIVACGLRIPAACARERASEREHANDRPRDDDDD